MIGKAGSWSAAGGEKESNIPVNFVVHSTSHSCQSSYALLQKMLALTWELSQYFGSIGLASIFSMKVSGSPKTKILTDNFPNFLYKPNIVQVEVNQI